MMRFARPALAVGAGRIGGVAKSRGSAPPPRLAKLSAPFDEVLTCGTKFALNVPTFQVRQPPLIFVAPGTLQSAVLVQPAMPASHIHGAYCGTPCEFGAPDEKMLMIASIWSAARQLASLPPGHLSASMNGFTTGVVHAFGLLTMPSTRPSSWSHAFRIAVESSCRSPLANVLLAYGTLKAEMRSRVRASAASCWPW